MVKPVNAVIDGLGTTIFSVMSALAVEHGAINLGQGFPDEDGPEDIRRAGADALMKGPNQYPPMMGVAALRQAVAAHDRRFYGFDTDWQSEVLITSGATEALAAGLFSLLNPGDEAVLVEPLYDSYAPVVRLAGATPRFVRLRPPEWRLDEAMLEAAFSEKTKLLLLNSPMNPAAKVFSAAELALIADRVRRFDAYVLCDEVYEHLVFDGHRHLPLRGLPGMAERCLRIGSAGKIFSFTGWKVAYVTGAAPLIGTVARAHQYLTFTTPPNLQTAVAHGLGREAGFYTAYAAQLAGKRDRLAKGLAAVGFDVLDCQATYFLSADFRPLGFAGNDVEFCRYITCEAGVAAVPVSAFYDSGGVDHLVRFCFCKQDPVLDEAVARLGRFFGGVAIP